MKIKKYTEYIEYKCSIIEGYNSKKDSKKRLYSKEEIVNGLKLTGL